MNLYISVYSCTSVYIGISVHVYIIISVYIFIHVYVYRYMYRRICRHGRCGALYDITTSTSQATETTYFFWGKRGVAPRPFWVKNTKAGRFGGGGGGGAAQPAYPYTWIVEVISYSAESH